MQPSKTPTEAQEALQKQLMDQICAAFLEPDLFCPPKPSLLTRLSTWFTRCCNDVKPKLLALWHSAKFGFRHNG